MRALVIAILIAATSAALPIAASARQTGWIVVREPTEWAVGAPLAAPAGALIRVRGEAFHPDGIREILVAGARATLDPEGGSAAFSSSFQVRPDMTDLEITVRATTGDVFQGTFIVAAEFLPEGLDFSTPWEGPDSLVLIVGSPDTVHVRGGQVGMLVPSRLLSWASDNAEVATVDSAGVVHPHGEGHAFILGTSFQRSVSVPITVYPRPIDLDFLPRDTVVTVVEGDRLSLRVDIQLTPTRVVRGVVPKLTVRDSAILRHEGAGSLLGLRPGESSVTASIGGFRRTWHVRVQPPTVAIRPLHGYSVLLGDSTRLRGRLIRPDGTVVDLGEGISWRTSNADVLFVRSGSAHARQIGRAELIASRGESQDSATFFVLGDLLAGVRIRNRDRVVTISAETGVMTPLTDEAMDAGSPELSPDGRQVVFVAQAGRRNRLFVMDADGRNPRRLVPDQQGLLGVRTSTYEEVGPRWSHDGQRVVFVSSSVGNFEVFSIRTDGSDLVRLTHHPAVDRNVSTAVDAPIVAFERIVSAGDSDIVVSNLDGSAESVLRTAIQGATLSVSESKPALLPGGRHVLFARGGPDLDPRSGETLTLFDLTTRVRIRDLTSPVRDHELIYAVSQDGSRIAVHQRALWGRKNSIITIIDLHGAVLGSVYLQGVNDVRHLSWGPRPF